MKVLVKLFNPQEKASDGSSIPRKSCDEYLASSDYQLIINDKLSLGGVTHKDRKLKPEYEGVIGMDDQLLVNDNATHYISKIFFKEGDPICYAFLEIFDPDLFSGERRDKIINLRGLLNSGVKLPVSVVIQALWSPSNVAEKIIRIKGVDFTSNPAFNEAGTVKVMSNFESMRVAEEVKSFSQVTEDKSLEGCVMVTKVFSASMVLIEEMPEHVEEEIEKEVIYSRNDIIKKWGLNSPQALSTKGFAEISEAKLQDVVEQFLSNQKEESEPVIDNLEEGDIFDRKGFDKAKFIDDIIKAEETDSLDEIMELAKKMVGSENSELIHIAFRDNKPKLIQILTSIPKDDLKREEKLKDSLNTFFRIVPSTAHFSTISSVRDRLLMAKYPRYALINRVLKSYSSFYETRKNNLMDNELNLLKILLIQDINLLIKQVQDKIRNGATLNSLFALTQFSPELASSGIKLSKLYRQVIIAEDVLGFIPQAKYKAWAGELKEFYDALCRYVYGSPYTEQVQILDKL